MGAGGNHKTRLPAARDSLIAAVMSDPSDTISKRNLGYILSLMNREQEQNGTNLETGETTLMKGLIMLKDEENTSAGLQQMLEHQLQKQGKRDNEKYW